MTAHITQSLDQTPGSFDSTAENSDSNGSRGRRVCYPAYQSAPRGLLWGKSPMTWRAEVLPLPCPLLNLVHSVSMASPWRRGGCYSLTPSVGIVSSVRSGKACLLRCLSYFFIGVIRHHGQGSISKKVFHLGMRAHNCLS